MPADSKLQMAPLGAGMDQSLDEFSVPFGNIRRAINTRVRKGGSIEMRHGVHGFSLGVPSLVGYHGLQPTGAIEWVSSLESAPLLGTSGKAFVFDRQVQKLQYAGAYSNYLPVKKSNAFLDEHFEMGAQNIRCTAIAFDSQGRKYTVIATNGSGGSTVGLIQVLDARGTQVLQFRAQNAFTQAQIVAAPDSHIVYVLSGFAGISIFAHQVILDGNNTSIVTTGSLGASLNPSDGDWAAAVKPAPGGTATLLLARHTGTNTLTLREHQWDSVGTILNTVNINITATSDLRMTLFANQTWAVLGYLRDPVTTGAADCTTVALSNFSVQNTGALLPASPGAYSSPIFGPSPVLTQFTSTSEFYWVIGYSPSGGNTRTRFGKLTVFGTVTEGGSIYGAVPISEFDPWGSIWCFWSGEVGYQHADEAPRFGRIGLVRFPNQAPRSASIDEIFRRVSLELTTDRLGPEALETSFVWGVGSTASPVDTARVSSIGVGPDGMAVLLPVMLRSQDTKLFGLELYEYQHHTHHQFRDTVVRGGALVTAGQPYEITKTGWLSATENALARNAASEVGFFEEPHVGKTGIYTLGVAPGTRSYRVAYEWISPSGERHRSRPSVALRHTNTQQEQVKLTIQPADVTSRFGWAHGASIVGTYLRAAVVHVYRTTSGGTQHLRITEDDDAPLATRFQGADVTYVDSIADDDIRDNEILYTEGGVQPNDLAPSCRFLAIGEDRLWVGGGWDNDIIQCSKAFAPREPIQFSDNNAFKVRLPFACTGLAYLDGAVVAFCENSIYTVSGSGPDARGYGGYTLRPIAGDVGCIDYRSIIETSNGVFFQSARGIELLPRGFGPPQLFRQLNDLMSDFGDGYSEVIGATNSQSSDEDTVRFLLRNPVTNERIVAVMELSTQTWSYDTIRDQANTAVPLSAIGDLADGTLYGAGSGPHKMLIELTGRDGTPYDSMGSTVNRFLGEVHMNRCAPFGDAGQGRLIALQLRGYSPGNGQMHTSIRTDRSIQSHIASGIGSGTYYRRCIITEPSTTEMQVTATFGTVSGNARGMRLISLNLELEPQPGARRANAGEQE